MKACRKQCPCERGGVECVQVVIWADPLWASKISFSFAFTVGFAGGSDSKEPACNVGDQCSIPGLGRSLEKEMATHSSILAWRIAWTEEPGGLQSMGCKESDTTEWLTLSLSLAFTVMELEFWNIFKKWNDPQIFVIWFTCRVCTKIGFPGGSVVKNLPSNSGDAGDMGLIAGSDPWIGKILWRREWLPTPGYCLENSTGRGVHGGAKSWPWLSTHTHTHLRSVLLFPNSFISYAKNFRLDGTVDRLPHPKLKARTMSPGNILQTPYSGVKPISQLYHVIRKCLYRN